MSDPILHVTHRIEFSSAHRLGSPDLDDAQNQETFGPCTRTHGHNYVLEATVAGPLDPRTGMVVNFNALEQVMREEVFDRVDHRMLNEDVPALADLRVFTAENLVVAFWELLSARESEWKPCRLRGLRLFETAGNSVEYFGPQA